MEGVDLLDIRDLMGHKDNKPLKFMPTYALKRKRKLLLQFFHDDDYAGKHGTENPRLITLTVARLYK
jgi:hypothetical protein